MPLPRIRPEFAADERTQLVGWLDLQRAVVAWKCDGLSEDDAHRSLLPTSPLMTMAGIVSHLRWMEHLWFEAIFLGGDSSVNPSFLDEPANAEMRVDGVPLERLLREYEEQCARSNEIVAAHSLDDRSRNEHYRTTTGTLRWILIHMVEETARHAGHADVVRELLDGGKGYY